MPRKTCTSCNRSLPVTAFYVSRCRSRKPHRRSKCIECYIIAQTERNERRVEEKRVYDRQRRASGKDNR